MGYNVLMNNKVQEKVKGRFATVAKAGQVYNGQIIAETPYYVRFRDRNSGETLMRHKKGLSIQCAGKRVL